MANYAPGQNPRYNRTFLECMHAKTDRFFTRMYAGVLPAYPHDDFDIWIDKPGHVDSVMVGQPSPPPLTQYRVSIDFTSQRGKHDEFFADSVDEIILVLGLQYFIPATKIGWDY